MIQFGSENTGAFWGVFFIFLGDYMAYMAYMGVWSSGTQESVAIGDFGVSRPLTHAMELVTTMVGTPCYLSPEVPFLVDIKGK